MLPTGDGEFPNVCTRMTQAEIAAEHTSAAHAALARISGAFSFVVFALTFLIPADSSRTNGIFLEFPATVTRNLPATPLLESKVSGRLRAPVLP